MKSRQCCHTFRAVFSPTPLRDLACSIELIRSLHLRKAAIATQKAGFWLWPMYIKPPKTNLWCSRVPATCRPVWALRGGVLPVHSTIEPINKLLRQNTICLTLSTMSWFTHEAEFAAAVGSSQMYPFILIVRRHYEAIMAGRYKPLVFSVVRFWLVHLTASEIDNG